MYTCFAPALLRLRENAAEPVVVVRIGWIVVVPVSRPDIPIVVVPGAATFPDLPLLILTNYAVLSTFNFQP